MRLDYGASNAFAVLGSGALLAMSWDTYRWIQFKRDSS
jgi:hypothetical protein